MKKSASPAPLAAAAKPRGRPRSFDRELALERAMDVFWSKGFEAASLSDLTEAMGINPPSLYAAFGDKEGLFIEAVQRYHANAQQNCPYGDLPTAREAVENLLTFAATLFTDPGHPRGCLAVRLSRPTAGALKIVRLPFPRPVIMNAERLPASYANFYIANGVVIVPTFNDRNDRVALNALAELMPDRHVVGIHAVDLVWGFGTLHCLTQQQPAPR